MEAKNIRLIKEIGDKLKNSERDKECVESAIYYTLTNADLTLKEKQERLYKEYLDAAYKILYHMDSDNSMSWWKLSTLVKLQSLSRTTDNIVSDELRRRYIVLRNNALKLTNFDTMRNVINHLPPATENDFYVFFHYVKKEYPLPKEFYDILKDMLIISDSTNLGLDIDYALGRKKSKK